jgi:hypothetical protein
MENQGGGEEETNERERRSIIKRKQERAKWFTIQTKDQKQI